MALTKEYTLTTAIDQAMRFLAPRFLSRLELTQKLQRKGVPADLIHQVLERLEDLDYINDERLAHDALQLYISEAKYSVQFIRNKLYQRGLPIGNELRSMMKLSRPLSWWFVILSVLMRQQRPSGLITLGLWRPALNTRKFLTI